VIEARAPSRPPAPASAYHPLRTLQWEEQGTIGSFEYVKAHRAELDKIRAMITYDSGIGRVTGYSLGGRRDIEDGVREVLNPLESWERIPTPTTLPSARTISISC